jgi:hypothetical protein
MEQHRSAVVRQLLSAKNHERFYRYKSGPAALGVISDFENCRQLAVIRNALWSYLVNFGEPILLVEYPKAKRQLIFGLR